MSEVARTVDNSLPLWRITLALEGTLAAVAWLVATWFQVGLQPDPPGWRWEFALLAGLTGCLPLLAIALQLDRVSYPPLQRIRRLLQDWLGDWLRQSHWAQRWLLAALAGVGEELFFRGLLQHGLSQWWPEVLTPPVTLVTASLAFGLCHAVTPAYLIVATLVGFWLGWLFQLTGHLVAPVVAHALYDGCLLEYYRWQWQRPAESAEAWPE